jgi:hypothetical protein
MITFFATNPNVSQGISNYNAGLNREALARIAADTEIQRAQMDAAARRDAMRQQAMQQQQQNQLAREQMLQQGQFQQGTLANQRYTADAEKAWREANARALAENAALDRANRLAIAEKQYGYRDDGATAEANQLAMAAQNYASQLNELDELQKQADELGTLKSSMKDLPGIDAIGTEGKKSKFFNQLPYSVPADPNLPFDDNLTMANNTLTRRIQEIISGTAPLRESFQPFVKRGPDNKWMSTLQPGAPTAPAAPTAGTSSGGGGGYFGGAQTPAVVPAPKAATQAPPPAETPAPRRDGPRVKVRFPNGTEADIPTDTLEAAKKEFGATEVSAPTAQLASTTVTGDGQPPRRFMQGDARINRGSELQSELQSLLQQSGLYGLKMGSRTPFGGSDDPLVNMFSKAAPFSKEGLIELARALDQPITRPRDVGTSRARVEQVALDPAVRERLKAIISELLVPE